MKINIAIEYHYVFIGESAINDPCSTGMLVYQRLPKDQHVLHVAMSTSAEVGGKDRLQRAEDKRPVMGDGVPPP